MAEVIPFDSDKRRAFTSSLDGMMQQGQAIGSGALARLKKCRKLSADDRVALAKAMHKILEGFPNISSKALAAKAGFVDTKELHRLTLPPGADPFKRRPRAEGKKYVWLLEALQKLTKGNLSTMADSLTYACSFHPRQTLGFEESEKMINTLQEAINRIDRNFCSLSGGDTLFETFMKTAEAKAGLGDEGRYLSWPYADWYEETIDHSSEEEQAKFPFNPRPEDRFDPIFAYWKRDYSAPVNWTTSKLPVYVSWVDHHNALMQLPRVFLGTIAWNAFLQANPPRGCEPTSNDAIQEEVSSMRRSWIAPQIGELRDPISGDAIIAHRNPFIDEWMPGINGTYTNENGKEIHASADGSGDVWLVIYPAPGNQSLIPVLYHPCEEGGTLLTPLSERSLITLKEISFVDDGEQRNLYVRIRELMVSEDTSFPIYEQWKTTAGDILRNPILRAHKAKLTKQAAFKKSISAFWQEDQNNDSAGSAR